MKWKAIVVMWKPAPTGLHRPGFGEFRVTMGKVLGERRVVEVEHDQARDTSTDDGDASIAQMNEPVTKVGERGTTLLKIRPGYRADFGPLRIKITIDREYGITEAEIALGDVEKVFRVPGF
jgi:hypothetical protein